jgi:hypothetical protein
MKKPLLKTLELLAAALTAYDVLEWAFIIVVVVVFALFKILAKIYVN